MLQLVARSNVPMVSLWCRRLAKFLFDLIIVIIRGQLPGSMMMVAPVRPPVVVWITVGLLTLTRLTYLLIVVLSVIALANGQRPVIIRLTFATLRLVRARLRLRPCWLVRTLLRTSGRSAPI